MLFSLVGVFILLLLFMGVCVGLDVLGLLWLLVSWVCCLG